MSQQDSDYETSPKSDEPNIQQDKKKLIDQISLDIIISYKDMLLQKLYLCNDEIEKYSLDTRLEHVNNHLAVICQHKWYDDHIETGPDKDMKKITYCEICELDQNIVYHSSYDL